MATTTKRKATGRVKISAYKYVRRNEMANKVVGVCKYSLFGKLSNYFRTFLMNV